MRRTISRLAVFVLLCAAAVLVPVSSAHAVGTCPGGGYPVSPGATVAASTTTPTVGQIITVSGSGYCADEDVTITIDSTRVGTGHTDSTGKFGATTVTVPGPSGTKQLTGAGASGVDGDSDSLTLDVQGSTSSAAAGSTGGGTALTGVQIAAIVAIAAVLLGAGVAFASAGRRRKPATRS